MSIFSTKAQLSTIADMPLLRLFLIGWAMPLVLQLACSSTDDHINVHVTIWDGAVIIDSTTLAVVGWEYDHAQPADAWASSEYSNIYQYLYKYHLEDSSLELVATLSDNAAFYATNPGVLYSEPWVVYTTNDGSAAVGMYNLVTGEKRDAYDRGVELAAVSAGAHWVAVHHGNSQEPLLIDASTGAVVAELPDNLLVFHVDDSSSVFATMECSVAGCNPVVGRYDTNTSTFLEADSTELGIYRTASDKTVAIVPMFADSIGLCDIASLRQGVLRLNAVAAARVTPDDVHASGAFVVRRGRTIYFGNYRDGLDITPILHMQEREL